MPTRIISETCFKMDSLVDGNDEIVRNILELIAKNSGFAKLHENR